MSRGPYWPRVLVAPWVSLPVFVMLVVNWSQRGSTWRGDPLLAVDAQGIVMFVAGPLVLAAVAVDVARAGNPGNQHLVALTRPTMRPYVYAVMGGALPSSVALFLVGGASLGLAAVHYATVGLLLSGAAQLVLFAVALMFMAVVGSLVGKASSPVVAGILGVIVGLVLSFSDMSKAGNSFSLLALGGSTVSRVGLEYSNSYRLWQISLFAAVGLFCYFAVPRFTALGTRWSASVIVAALLVGVATFARIPLAPTSVWAVSSAPREICSGEFPDLCMSAPHEYARDTIAPLVRQLTNGAQSAGLTGILPQRIVETTRADQDPPDGVQEWAFTLDEPTTLVSLTMDLLTPKGCSRGPTLREEEAFIALSTGLLVAAGEDPLGLPFGETGSDAPLTLAQAKKAQKVLLECN